MVQWLFQFLKVSFADLLNIFKPALPPFRILKSPDKPTVSLWIVTSPPTVLPGNIYFLPTVFSSQGSFFYFLPNVLPVIVRPAGGALIPLHELCHLEIKMLSNHFFCHLEEKNAVK